MLFSYNWLQEYIAKKLPSPQKLAELLAMRAFEIDGMKQMKNDWILDVKILPHRPDAMSHAGLAREISAICELPLKLPKTATIKPAKGTLAPLRIKIADATLVPRYSAIVIEGIAIKESPDWLKTKLNSLGINAINNIVDITNYIMLELGQPLHAFDYDKIQGHIMHVRSAKAGEKILSLDDKTFTLPEGAIIIEDSGRVIDLAGIKGGKLSGIGETSKNVILEAANFHGKTIYKTKKFIQYTTPAADLFSHNISPHGTQYALERAYALVIELCGGKLVQYADIYKRKQTKISVVLEFDTVKKLLGTEIPLAKAKNTLKRLGFDVTAKKSAKETTLKVTAPLARRDIAIPEDIVEEIGRIYGYENIEASFPSASIRPALENPRIALQETLRGLLASAGMAESYNYSFIGEKDLEQLCYSPKETAELVELANPLSEDVKYLRSSLVDNLVKNIAANHKMFPKETIALFEIGKAFIQPQEKTVQESVNIAGILAKPEQNSNGAFFELKGIAEYVMGKLGIKEIEFREPTEELTNERRSLWKNGAVAEITSQHMRLGTIGELSPSILSQQKITRTTAAFQLDFDALLTCADIGRAYRAPAKFPGVARDISLFVPLGTKAADVFSVILQNKDNLLSSVKLFDVFEGGALTQEKKSFAFHFLYQSEQRTLTGKEVDAAHEAIVKELQKHEGWEVR